MPPFGQVDADTQRMFQGAQRERPPLPGGVEESGEGGPVQQGHPVGEGRSGVAVGPVLAGPGVELAQHRLLSPADRPEVAAQRLEGGGHLVEQFAQLGHGREAVVRRPERAEELGEGGRGPAHVDPGDVPDEGLGEQGGGLVGVGGAAVEVEVVDGGGVADADHDVVGVVRPELGPGRADGDDGGLAGERLEREDSTTGRTRRRVLPLPEGPTARSEVPSTSGSRANPVPRRAYGLRTPSSTVPSSTCRASRSCRAARTGRSRAPDGCTQAPAPLSRTASSKALIREGSARTESQARRMRA